MLVIENDNVIIEDEVEVFEVPIDTDISFYIVEPSSLTSMSPRRNPSQNSHPPPRVHDYVTYTVRYPVHNFINYHKVLFVHAAFLIKISSENEPRIF